MKLGDVIIHGDSGRKVRVIEIIGFEVTLLHLNGRRTNTTITRTIKNIQDKIDSGFLSIVDDVKFYIKPIPFV